MTPVRLSTISLDLDHATVLFAFQAMEAAE
jgi:hypothetical protein